MTLTNSLYGGAIAAGILLCSYSSSAQTRSTHTSPSDGVEYSSGTIGLCGSCTVSNPANAADLSGLNKATISVPFGVAGAAFLELELSETVSSGATAGLLIERSGGLASSSVLNTYTITTYLGGVTQETMSGSSNISAQLKSGSSTMQSIHFTSSEDFDKVRISVGALVTLATNTLDVYYSYGHSSPLPIELMNFYGSAAGNQIVINWETASEYNNSYFDVEKVYPEVGSMILGSVKGSISSSKKISYSYKDDNPEEGANYYRLKQVDCNGDYSYSNMINVEFENSEQPSVTHCGNNRLTITANGDSKIELLNTRGEVLSTHSCLNKIDIETNHLVPGIYWVLIKNSNGKMHTEKIVKI